MKTLSFVVVLALSFLAAQSVPFQGSSFFMQAGNEGLQSMDVPFVSFDDMAFEILKSDALSTTTEETTTVETTATTSHNKTKKKRHNRKNRSRLF